MNARLFSFIGGDSGLWRVTNSSAIAGEPLCAVARLDVVPGAETGSRAAGAWSLRGITSNERYVIREEKNQLVSKQQGLGRPEATCAALIPLRKNAEWWALTQDERRKIFEEQSHHNQIGMRYLPAVARKLHHCRDLSENEPFDFLTWFEFAPAHEREFDQLLAALRASEEWQYVEREVDIRLVRASS
jgi:chlorite dismutase